VQHQPAVGDFGDTAAGFHRLGQHPGDVAVEPHPARRRRDRGPGRRPVAALPDEADIVQHLVPDRRRARRTGVARLGHDFDVVEVDLHQLGRLARHSAGLGDDKGHALAGEPGLALGEHRAQGRKTGALFSIGSLIGQGMWVGSPATARSAWVQTPSTPGASRAAETSSPAIAPGIGARAKAAWTMPSSVRSPT